MAMLQSFIEPYRPLVAQPSVYLWVNMQYPPSSSSSSLRRSNSSQSQGILAGPSHVHPTAAESPSGSRSGRLVFTRTPPRHPRPLPSDQQHQHHGRRKSVRDRPPTPGGLVQRARSQTSSSSISSEGHPITIPALPFVKGSQSTVSKKDIPQSRPRFGSSPSASSSSALFVSPVKAGIMQDEGPRFPPSSSRSPASTLSRSRSTTAVINRTPPSRIEIPDARPGSSSSSNLPDSPGTKALMERLMAAPDPYGFGHQSDYNHNHQRHHNEDFAIDDYDDDGSETSSIRFASVKDGFGRSASRISGSGISPISPTDRRQRGNEKLSRLLGTTSEEDFARSRFSGGGGRMANDGRSFGEDGYGGRIHGYDHQLSAKAKGKQRMSDVLEDEESIGRSGRLRHSDEVEHRPRYSTAYSPHQQTNVAHRSSRVQPHPSPTSPPMPSPQHSASPRLHALDALLPRHNTSPGPPRSYALDALSPNHGVKRSQSASAAAPASQNHQRQPLRSPATSSFSIPSSQRTQTMAVTRSSPTPSKGPSLPPSPNLPWKTADSRPLPVVDAPLVLPRTSSKPGEGATDGKKAKRRRSALVWMKEQATSIIPSPKSVPHSPVSKSSPDDTLLSRSQSSSISMPVRANHGQHGLNNTVQHGFSKSEGSNANSRQTLGVPRRSGSALGVVSSSSPNSPARPPMDPLPELSPPRRHAHPDRPRGSLEMARNRRAEDVSLRIARVGSTEDRWRGQEDVFTGSGSTVISAAGGSKATTHKAEKSSSSFSFGLARSLSAKKPSSSTKEEKRQRGRLRGKGNEKLKEQNLTPDGRKSRDESYGAVDRRPQNRRSYSLSHVVQPLFDEHGLPLGEPPARIAAADRLGYATPPRRKVELQEASSSTPVTAGSSGGGKFWKFVKRISSSGGLRDKYEDHAVPPVPHLPSHVSATRSPATSPVSEGRGASDISVTRFLSSPRANSLDDSEPPPPASPSSKPSSKPLAGSSSRLKYSAAATPPGDSNIHLSTPHSLPQTRSSTPASGEQVKIKQQHQIPSGHSSASSLIDQKPLPPPSSLSPRIHSPYRPMPSPSDRGHLSDGGYPHKLKRKSSKGRRIGSERDLPFASDDNWTPVDSPALEFPSLPAPPRRYAYAPPSPLVESVTEGLFSPSKDELDSNEDLSSIPEFSVEDVINTFAPRRGSNAVKPSKEDPPTEALPLPAPPVISVLPSGSLTPPPRPARNVRRPPPTPSTTDTEDTVSQCTYTTFTKSPSPDSQATHSRPLTGTFGPNAFLTLPRKSTPSPSLSQAQDSEIFEMSPSDTIHSADWRSLTEKEKADKWEALLEKSERAGGTLHMSIRGDLFSA